MKRKFYLIVALVLVLIISSGIFAYTYTTVIGMISIIVPTGDIATVSATATQPVWDSVLTPVTNTENFRPDAAGDRTDIGVQYPASGEHWDKVDEATSDDDSTYVASDGNKWKKDYYHIPDHSTQTVGGTINHVKVYMVVRSEGTPTQESARVRLKTYGTEEKGNDETVTANYTAYSYQWDTNPETGQAWTWAEIDALQIGVELRNATAGIPTRCTQVYTEVSFDAPPLTGNTPTGDLFEIAAHADYSGDLLVRVYLTNTDSLQKAYDYLNMELFLEGSVEAGEPPNYQTLTMENGLVTFNLVGISGDSDTLSVTGGDYRLVSRHIPEWEAGYTVTPELYCEVTQR